VKKEKFMKRGFVEIWVLLILMLTVCPAGTPSAKENNRVETAANAAPTGPGSLVEEGPLRLAGLLDKLLDPESKERKMLEGATSILSATGEIDYKSERTIGESLALEAFRRYGMPVNDPALQKYVNLVGLAVARNSLRPGIPYVFVVVESPLQNAFSCPGGIIFISSALFKTMETEAQLAGVLAHEVAHVAQKHALQSIKRARFFQGVGKITSATMKGDKGKQFEDMIGDLQNILFDKGLDQNMEFEADQGAMKTAYRTGYNPTGLMEVLKELKRIEAGSKKKGSWFSTHPPLSDRIAKCREKLPLYPDRANLAQLPERLKKEKNRVSK
jgi:predicted Zn-dependent protease